MGLLDDLLTSELARRANAFAQQQANPTLPGPLNALPRPGRIVANQLLNAVTPARLLGRPVAEAVFGGDSEVAKALTGAGLATEGALNALAGGNLPTMGGERGRTAAAALAAFEQGGNPFARARAANEAAAALHPYQIGAANLATDPLNLAGPLAKVAEAAKLAKLADVLNAVNTAQNVPFEGVGALGGQVVRGTVNAAKPAVADALRAVLPQVAEAGAPALPQAAETGLAATRRAFPGMFPQPPDLADALAKLAPTPEAVPLDPTLARSQAIKAFAARPMEDLVPAIRDLGHAVYGEASAPYALRALLGLPKQGTIHLTPLQESRALEPLSDYLVARAQGLETARPLLERLGLHEVPPSATPLEEHKRLVQALFGVEPPAPKVPKARAGVPTATESAAPNVQVPEALAPVQAAPEAAQQATGGTYEDALALIRGRDNGKMGEYVPEGADFWQKRGFDPAEARQFLDRMQAEGILGRDQHGALAIRPAAPVAPTMEQAAADPALRQAWQQNYIAQSRAGTDFAGTDIAGLAQADWNKLSPQERLARIAAQAEPAPPLNKPAAEAALSQQTAVPQNKAPSFDNAGAALTEAQRLNQQTGQPYYILTHSVTTPGGAEAGVYEVLPGEAPPILPGQVDPLPLYQVGGARPGPVDQGPRPPMAHPPSDEMQAAIQDAHARGQVFDDADVRRYRKEQLSVVPPAGEPAAPPTEPPANVSALRARTPKPTKEQALADLYGDTRSATAPEVLAEAAAKERARVPTIEELRRRYPGMADEDARYSYEMDRRAAAKAAPTTTPAAPVPVAPSAPSIEELRARYPGLVDEDLAIIRQNLTPRAAAPTAPAAPSLRRGQRTVSYEEARAFAARLGRIPSPGELQDEFKLPLGEANRVQDRLRAAVSKGGDVAAGGMGGQLPISAATTFAGGALGAAGGAVAGAQQGDTPQERALNAIGGGIAGGLAGGAAGAGAVRFGPELTRAFEAAAPTLLKRTGLSPDAIRFAHEAGLAAQAAAKENKGAGSVGKALAEADQFYRDQAVTTVKNQLQDVVTTWGKAVEFGRDFGLKASDYDTAYDSIIANKGGLSDGVQQLLDEVGQSDYDYRGKIGAGQLGAETATQSKLTGVGRAITGAAVGLGNLKFLAVAPVAPVWGAARGYFNPYARAFFHALNGAMQDAMREAFSRKLAERQLAGLGNDFLGDLAARGIDTTDLERLAGRFAPEDVKALVLGQGGGAALATSAANDWRQLVEAGLDHATKRTAFVFGNFSREGSNAATRAVGKVSPFSSWAIKNVLPTAELISRHPLVALQVARGLAASAEKVRQQGLPGYYTGTIPFTSETPVVGPIARARLGGAAGTVRLNPMNLFSPVPGEILTAGDEGAPDQTGYQQLKGTLSTIGLGIHPLAQAGAYVAGQDYTPGSPLSRTAGLEQAARLIPGMPELPSALVPLNALRAAGHALLPDMIGAPGQYDPIANRAAELYREQHGGVPIRDDPAALASLNDPNSPLMRQARQEVLLREGAGNATSLTFPMGTLAATTSADQAKSEKAAMPYDYSALKAIERAEPQGKDSARYKSAVQANEQYLRQHPAAATYEKATGQGRSDALMQQWDLEHQGLHMLAPAVWAKERKAYQKSITGK
ncbi:MAG TPA: hypothetical protein VF041_23375 [Gemmatimonadaceae bacterium]